MKQVLHGFPVDSAITRTVVLSFILMLFVSLMAPPGICMSIRDPKDSIANLVSTMTERRLYLIVAAMKLSDSGL